jgi:hypothetical protein
VNTFIPGPGEDGYALRDEESAAEALGYPSIAREGSDQDDERAHFELANPIITTAESQALRLGARALAEVADGLLRAGNQELAAESAGSAATLHDLLQRSVIGGQADAPAVELEAER